jgi:hypothetical protein
MPKNKQTRIVIMLDGPDAEKALAELLSNAQYDKLEVAVWSADKPWIVKMGASTLSYAPEDIPQFQKKMGWTQ